MSELNVLAQQIDAFVTQYAPSNDGVSQIRENLRLGNHQDMKDYITMVGDKLNQIKEATELVMLIDEHGDRNYPRTACQSSGRKPTRATK